MTIRYTTEQLEKIAHTIRGDIILSLAEAGSGHLGGSLGVSDILTVLYFDIMQHRAKDPIWAARDRFILSIGHVAPAYYAALANAGYFSREELYTLRKLGSRLQGHPGRDHHLPGIELSAGSLGQGLSVAVGMALSGKMDNASHHIFSLHGDGELQEGSIWEAAMSAGHHKLHNLIAIVDRNNVQIDGPTEKVMQLEPLADKWHAFGWDVMQCNGNSIEELRQTLTVAIKHTKKPTVIIAHTHMGQGVESITNNYKWHGKAPSHIEAKQFIEELNNYYSKTNGPIH